MDGLAALDGGGRGRPGDVDFEVPQDEGRYWWSPGATTVPLTVMVKALLGGLGAGGEASKPVKRSTTVAPLWVAPEVEAESAVAD